MPTRTIAPAGGNWNSTATWVEGSVPISGDLIVGAATSGNLTINVNPSFVYVMDMTNYAATMSISTATFTMPSHITTPALNTSTFSSTMTIAYSSINNAVVRTSGNQNTSWSFLGNGTFGEFPNISLSQQSQTLTINGILKANSLSRTNATTTINSGAGGGTMSISRYVGFPGGGGLMTGTCPIVFDRTSGEWTNSYTNLGGGVGNPVVINTPGTFSITSSPGLSYGFLGIRADGNLKYISGTIADTNKNLYITNLGNGTVQSNVTSQLDLSGSGTWSSIHIFDTAITGSYNSTLRNNINLVSDLYFNELRIQASNSASPQAYGGGATFRLIIRFTGSGRLKGGYLRGQTNTISVSPFYATIPSLNGTNYFVPRVELEPSLPVNSFTGIQLYGIPDTSITGSSPSFCRISSSSGVGTRAHISVQEPTALGVQFENIDASAGVEIKNYFGTNGNTVNITSLSSLPSGGGSGGSFTFVN